MEWMTIQDMANYVDKSKGTAWAWVKKFGLSIRKLGSTAMVNKLEVDAVLDADTREFHPTPQLFAVLYARLDKLEREVTALQYAAGEYNAHSMTDIEVRTWYHTIQELAKGEVPSSLFPECISLLESFNEGLVEHLLSLEYDRPWIPAILLCVNLSQAIRQDPLIRSDLNKQLEVDQISKLQAKIRGIALCFIEADLDATARTKLRSVLGDLPLLPDLITRRIQAVHNLRAKIPLKDIGSLLTEALERYQKATTTSQKGKVAELLGHAARLANREYRQFARSKKRPLK